MTMKPPSGTDFAGFPEPHISISAEELADLKPQPGGIIRVRTDGTFVDLAAQAERQKKWDFRFMRMAELVSSFSKDPSTKVGAVIVYPDNTVLSMGFNGFPKGSDDSPALYADRERKYERVVHAELNAILAAKARPQGCTLYCYPFLTCARCAAAIIQSGIIRVVYLQHSGVIAGDRWEGSWAEARQLYRECHVELVELSDLDWLRRG